MEIYSSFAFMIVLNENYVGPNVEFSYTYDVIACSEIEKNIKIEYDGELKGDQTVLNIEFIDTLRKKLARVISIADKNQIDTIISDIIKGSIKNTLGKYPEGIQITPKMLDELIHELAEEAAPFLVHVHNKNPRSKKR
jgi:hypothetical protein